MESHPMSDGMSSDVTPSSATHLGRAQSLWQDRLWLGTLLAVSLIIGYQLVVTLLVPPWAPAATNWLRVSLAWPETLLLVLLSWWLTRTHQPGAGSWWLLSVSLLGYAVGKTLLVVFEQVIFARPAPFPWWSDLFYLLTLPCFFLALVLWPGSSFHRQRVSRPTYSRAD